MQFDEFKTRVLGEWQGTKQLYLAPPPAAPASSASKLSVSPIAGGSFLQFDYNWTYEEEEQTGVLWVGYDNDDNAATAAWVDSFHMSGKIMSCTGAPAEGAIDLRGSYEAPPDPDWGWRIQIQSVSAKELKIVMHNISPAGVEDLAVQIDYARSA